MSKVKDLEKKYEAAIENIYKIAKENSPVRVKAEYIGCKSCGSRLAKKYIKLTADVCKCPVCNSTLFSETAQKRIKNAKEKAQKIKTELGKEQIKEKKKLSLSAILQDTRDRFDYILEEHKTPDFIEIVGKIGGDAITLRVYNNGEVYEK